MHILVLCTGNSARSIVGEYLLRRAFQRAGLDVLVSSAGSKPVGRVNPAALELLADHDFDTSGARSKSWDEFATPGAKPIDLVITVCAAAAGETCPIWPGAPVTVHWGLPDPANVEPAPARAAAFRVVYRALEGAADGLARAVQAGLTGRDLQQAAERLAPQGEDFGAA